MTLIRLLRSRGPHTATQAAEATGESVATCFFHLRQLAKYGLVEQVEGDHGRAKPWRATALTTKWVDDPSDPALSAAVSVLDTAMLDRYHERGRQWLERRTDEPAAWRKAALESDWILHVTAA